ADGNLLSALRNKDLKDLFNKGQERLSYVIAIFVPVIWQQSPAQGVRPGNAGFQNGSGRCEFFQACVFLNSAQSMGSGKDIDNGVLTPLIMGCRPPLSEFVL